MYETFYIANLLLFKKRHIESIVLRLHKNRKEAKKKRKARNFSTIVIQFMVRNFFGIKE